MMPKPIDPTYLDHPLQTISALYNPQEPLWSNINPNSSAKWVPIFIKLKLKLIVPQLIDPTYLDNPLCAISALYNCLDPLSTYTIPYNSAKWTPIFMKLEI